MTASPVLAAPDLTTIRSAMSAAQDVLAARETPDLDAQVLLGHILKVGRSYLFTHGERKLNRAQQRALRTVLERRAAGEPVAYIVGVKGFYDIDLLVTPAVLIPRPETELLLEEALRLTVDRLDLTAADIGTGSGALAVAFARQRPLSAVYASDISGGALGIARRNAARNNARVQFLLGDLATPFIERGIQLDLLLANLPYIPSADLARLEVSRYEPRAALDGGADGLRPIAQLLAQLPHVCNPGARILLEIGADQAESVAALVRQCCGVPCAILPDYAGLDRIASFQIG